MNLPWACAGAVLAGGFVAGDHADPPPPEGLLAGAHPVMTSARADAATAIEMTGIRSQRIGCFWDSDHRGGADTSKVWASP